MASASRLSAALLEELRLQIADNRAEAEAAAASGSSESFVVPARVPPELSGLIGRALPAPPLAIAVDVYGTLLASVAGEIGLGDPWNEDGMGESDASGGFSMAFPGDMASRLRGIVEADHAEARGDGVPWPEVDSPSVFARALGLDYDNGARACVAWECAANACTAMPGALEFLSCCRKGGLPLGIVSNAQFYTPLFIEDAFGKRLFGGSGTPSEDSLGFDPELALWSFETGRAKPDRWMFDELARRLSRRGVPADRILFIGNDALNDCAAAGEAGLMTALFCGDARSFKPRLGDARVIAEPPDTLAASWEDLRRLVCT